MCIGIWRSDLLLSATRILKAGAKSGRFHTALMILP